MNDRVRLAASNNVEWCDAVCRALGRPGEFTPALWLNRQPAPPFYPNAITLNAEDGARQFEAIAALTAELAGNFAVKDSFATLDLSPLGFEPLFSATWIYRDASDPVPAADAGLSWEIVTTPESFAAWQAGWAGNSASPSPFAMPLLADRNITLIGGWRGNTVMAGAALNRSAGAVGWSNVFGPSDDPACRAAALGFALRIAGNMPLVGYEHGEDLAQSLDLGFAACGPLTIWGH